MGTSSDPIQDGSDEQQKRSEIYTYEAPWQIYAMNWSVRCDKKYHFAITSLLEQYPNRVEIVQLDESNGEIRSDPNLTFEHPYPHTKTIFIPDKECQRPDRLATSSDFLRLWRIADDHSRVELKSCLNSTFSDEILAIDALRKERALTLGRDRTMLLHKMSETSRTIYRAPASSLESCCFISETEYLSGSDRNALLKKKPVFLLKNAHSVVASVITTNGN
ncbi:hypothetical protein Bca52824_059515 [Brassica carinata]|uniref:Uncharacterized protein n=1 Tax=Brassica carinata TaxID=52824 RepID=A0A8X7UES1_BRACI|nr:hypothetical protein Bca52824_059515 [Brassica carinata]